MGRKRPDKVEGQLSLLDEIEKVSYTEEQKNFIEYDSKDSVILAATAGAGKTFSCVQRLKYLINKGVDPNKIIFFSFTNAAVKELAERVEREGIPVRKKISEGNGVTITTIHSFCNSLLARMGKFKKIAGIWEFLDWYKKEYRPSDSTPKEQKDAFWDMVYSMYDEADVISSHFASFKLQSADGVKVPIPPFWSEYSSFLKSERARDFSDMLIEVRNFLREDKYLKMFRNKYDYIFVDEYQDTSAIQLEVLLALNAKHYYLIGDRNQSIYGYSGANCKRLEAMLKHRRRTVEKSLTINFRSDKLIIENSNKYSTLEARPQSKEMGHVDRKIMFTEDHLIDIIKSNKEVAVLVRTNAVIRQLEMKLLLQKVPMRYQNFLNHNDFKAFSSGNMNYSTEKKLKMLESAFDSPAEVFNFINQNFDLKKQVMTIHKSKGREFDTCVVVNSISPEILKENNLYNRLTKKQIERISFFEDDEDEEPRNIHYVAVSRSKHNLHFMIYDF
jgi:superfamily I DNA/RNA helicase